MGFRGATLATLVGTRESPDAAATATAKDCPHATPPVVDQGATPPHAHRFRLAPTARRPFLRDQQRIGPTLESADPLVLFRLMDTIYATGVASASAGGGVALLTR